MANLRLALQNLWKPFSVIGLLLGTLFFAASLTPSLVPRPHMIQGLVSGFSLAAGYTIGTFLRWLWHCMELPLPRFRTARALKIAGAIVCVAVAVLFLRQASEWQNSVRLLMEMEPVDTARPFTVGFVALAVFLGLLATGRLFQGTFRLISGQLNRFVPVRISVAVGALVAGVLFWTLINGVLFSAALRAADTSFQQLDALIEPDVEQPAEALSTGSAESLIDWDDVGRMGRRFLSSGPDVDELEAFLGVEAEQPLRVYVGLNSAETVDERAQLALAELLRVDAFEREVLILATPTGTGWLDPAAMDSVEYLHRGDIASVAVQYSYLSSPLSLIVKPDYGADTARTLFEVVYAYWRSLPHDQRPRLYLHGLSLGSLNSDLSFDIYDVVDDLFHGAVWSGPPYQSETWRSVTQRREPGSPAWLPRFRDSSVIRFMNQEGGLDMPGVPWGALRIAYIQYASDPVTFFDPMAFYRAPEWMEEPRGPDVSPDLRWFPMVTMLQLAADMLVGDAAPRGYGHRYAAADYIDAWLAVTRPADWTAAEIERLKARVVH